MALSPMRWAFAEQQQRRLAGVRPLVNYVTSLEDRTTPAHFTGRGSGGGGVQSIVVHLLHLDKRAAAAAIRKCESRKLSVYKLLAVSLVHIYSAPLAFWLFARCICAYLRARLSQSLAT